MATRVKVLFLCIGNSCRSQMAEAIARHRAEDIIEPSSAGLVPFGEIAPPTLKVLDEAGISASGQYSKPLRPENFEAWGELKRGLDCTLATGESLFSRFEFLRLLQVRVTPALIRRLS